MSEEKDTDTNVENVNFDEIDILGRDVFITRCIQ